MSIDLVTVQAMNLVAEFEGCELTAYYCPANVLTIGYGHTGDDVSEGMTITQDEAFDLLKQDLHSFALSLQDSLDEINFTPNQNQFDALLSFVYNLGIGSFNRSTLRKCLAGGMIDEAADEFLKWNKAGGVELKGLTRRREAERALFLS